jgi:hypothetical protein
MASRASLVSGATRTVIRGERWRSPVRDGRPRAGFLAAAAFALVVVLDVRLFDGVTLAL